MKKENIWQIVAWIAMFVFSILVIFFAIKFQNNLSHFRSWGLFGIFVVNFLSSATIFLPSPAIATVLAGGAVYSPMLVGFFATLGAVFGDMIGYFLGWSGTEIFLKKDHHWYKVGTDLFKKYGGLMVFIFALIPNPIFDAISIFAGALKYSPYKFFLWLFLGRLARNLILAFIGAQF